MRNIIDSIIRVLCTAIMGIMVVAVCWQVITRYVLNNPSTVTEEALRYLLVWTTMVGAAYAYGKRKHLSINILLKKVSAPVQKIVDIGVQCLVIVFCIVVGRGAEGRGGELGMLGCDFSVQLFPESAFFSVGTQGITQACNLTGG